VIWARKGKGRNLCLLIRVLLNFWAKLFSLPSHTLTRRILGSRPHSWFQTCTLTGDCWPVGVAETLSPIFSTPLSSNPSCCAPVVFCKFRFSYSPSPDSDCNALTNTRGSLCRAETFFCKLSSFKRWLLRGGNLWWYVWEKESTAVLWDEEGNNAVVVCPMDLHAEWLYNPVETCCFDAFIKVRSM